jgi:hypothetical protein
MFPFLHRIICQDVSAYIQFWELVEPLSACMFAEKKTKIWVCYLTVKFYIT